MSESQILLKCNERNDIESGGHFVQPIECETTPSVVEIGTTMSAAVSSGGNAKVLTPSTSSYYETNNERLKNVISSMASAGPSGSTMKSSRSSKKRKRDGRKSSRSAVQSCDSDIAEDEGAINEDEGNNQGRKKRQRRRKNRKYKPYSKLSWQERREQEDRETRRANRVRAQRFANGQPVAPYNTTQFLMDDHNDLNNIDGPPAHNLPQFPRCQKPQRCRDSSFSLDSEEDFYYSSPEDEKEFLTKEFSSAYEDLHAEQLNSLPKSKLVQDVLTLEKKVDVLEKELGDIRCNKDQNSDDMEEGTADERALLFKAEITKLSEENNRLRAENECLRRRCFGEDGDLRTHSDSSSSIDSDSDSTASSSGSCTSSCSSYTSSDGVAVKEEKTAEMVTEQPSTTDPPNVKIEETCLNIKTETNPTLDEPK